MMGGQVGVSDHLTIGSGVRIAAKSGAMRDIEAGMTVGGFTAVPLKHWHRQTAGAIRLSQSKKSNGGNSSSWG